MDFLQASCEKSRILGRSEASRGETEDSSSWKSAVAVSGRVQGVSIKAKQSCNSMCPSSESSANHKLGMKSLYFSKMTGFFNGIIHHEDTPEVKVISCNNCNKDG